MIYLLCFLAGVIFIGAISPIIDGGVQWLLSYFNFRVAYNQLRVSQVQKEINDLGLVQQDTHVVGFEMPSEECEDE